MAIVSIPQSLVVNKHVLCIVYTDSYSMGFTTPKMPYSAMLCTSYRHEALEERRQGVSSQYAP